MDSNKTTSDDLTSKDYYFDSYSRFGIHEEMLQDEVRTITYRDSMYHNPHLFKDKVVLDVGCGTGILCLFAIKAGAKMAIGIDCSSIIEYAKEIVKANGCEDKIKLIRGKVEEVTLPDGVDQVDIIISEWMGYCLFYETMLPTVLYARDKWLRPGGMIFPDKASLYICGIEYPEKRFERVEWWNNVQEFDMSCLGEVALSEPSVDFADEKQVITNTVLIKEIDILTMKVSELEFSTQFQLNIKKNERLDALLTYFTCDFSACHKRVSFTTAPLSNDIKGTHWKQTMFLLDQVVEAKKGDEICGTFSCWPNSRNHRDLDFEINLAYNGQDGEHFNKKMKYRMR